MKLHRPTTTTDFQSTPAHKTSQEWRKHQDPPPAKLYFTVMQHLGFMAYPHLTTTRQPQDFLHKAYGKQKPPLKRLSSFLSLKITQNGHWRSNNSATVKDISAESQEDRRTTQPRSSDSQRTASMETILHLSE